MGFPHPCISYEKLPAAPLLTTKLKSTRCILKNTKNQFLVTPFPMKFVTSIKHTTSLMQKQSQALNGNDSICRKCQGQTHICVTIPEIAHKHEEGTLSINTNKTAGLTKQQHTDAQNGRKRFSIKRCLFGLGRKHILFNMQGKNVKLPITTPQRGL